MAGGIEWFRWHHGSVSDPKFGLVAKKASASVAEVLGVWVCLLEAASSSGDRGDPGGIDFEAIDYLLGLDDGKAQRIHERLCERSLIEAESGRITAWGKRQPKREDDSANDRKRRQRERDHAETLAAGVTGDESRNVTQCHAETEQVTQGHAREEESREEEGGKPPVVSPDESGQPTDGDAKLPPCPATQLVELYHEVLPELPRCRVMPEDRRKAIKRRWSWVLTSKKPDGSKRAHTAADGMAWFRSYFERARSSDFLMGRQARAAGHEGWQCDLDFLLGDKGLKSVIEKTEGNA